MYDNYIVVYMWYLWLFMYTLHISFLAIVSFLNCRFCTPSGTKLSSMARKSLAELDFLPEELDATGGAQLQAIYGSLNCTLLGLLDVQEWDLYLVWNCFSNHFT